MPVFFGTAVAAFPGSDISLLHEIAPIGNKISPADSTGPQGALTAENQTVSGSCYLYFGNLQKAAGIITKDTAIKTGLQAQQSTSTIPTSATIVLRRSGRGVTYIDFFVPAEAQVSINLSDILGRKSVTLYNQSTSAGWHTYEFSTSGTSRPRGIYIVQLVSNGRTLVTRTLGAY